jgi:hypothetical protein
MKKLKIRLMEKGTGVKQGVPINMAFVDLKDIKAIDITEEEAANIIAEYLDSPVAINIFDMDAITTTSDGIVVESAITTMAAGDKGKVHPEFGILNMEAMEVTENLITEEPHLKQIKAYNFEDNILFRGPNPAKKLIPVHNVVMTGAAINNNSATEVMNAVTMEEMLLPYLGQKQIMEDGDILLGVTGQEISVGIGMTVAEKFGRVFPTRQFSAGETAHGSGDYAKTLKENIPIIVAPKDVLAKYIIRALESGMVPGKDIGCSPAVLKVAHSLGTKIDLDNINNSAWEELNSIGIKKEDLEKPSPQMTKEEIIENVEKIIPGVSKPKRVDSKNVVKKISININ